jgi:hypothetical protein
LYLICINVAGPKTALTEIVSIGFDEMSDLQYPQSFFSNWMKLMSWPNSFVPSEVNQAINPWTFGNFYYVSSENSGSPGTEAAVTAKASYGRQLGRVMSALADLIAEKPDAKQTRAMKDLVELHEQIKAIKKGRIEDRLSEIRKLIAETTGDDYKRVAQTLRAAMEERDRGQPGNDAAKEAA